MVISCSICGYRFPDSTGERLAVLIREHRAGCPAHDLPPARDAEPPQDKPTRCEWCGDIIDGPDHSRSHD